MQTLKMRKLGARSFILGLLLLLVICLLIYQKVSSFEESIQMTFSALGTLLATIIGVFFSFELGIAQQKLHESQNLTDDYRHSLPVVWAELDTNLTVLKTLHQAIMDMPRNIRNYEDQYEFLLSIASGVKTQAMSDLLSSGKLQAISKKDKKLFNYLQIANYNTIQVIVGLKISLQNFKSYTSIESIDQSLIDLAEEIILGEQNKIANTIKFIEDAITEIDKELEKFGDKMTKGTSTTS